MQTVTQLSEWALMRSTARYARHRRGEKKNVKTIQINDAHQQIADLQLLAHS